MGNPHVIDSPDMGNNERPASTSPPPFILNTASKRRAKVERILSTPEGARMSLRQVAGMALAHAISNKVEAAYRRSDLLDKRREMMGEWKAVAVAVTLEGFR